MYEGILVPLDGSITAESAIPYAVELADNFGSQLFLVEVCDPNSGDKERYCQDYLDSVTEKVKLQLIDRKVARSVIVRHQVLQGKPANEITRFSDSNSIRLIVMSRYGASGESTWFLGSIADKILRAARKSLLLVKEPPSDEVLQNNKLIRRLVVPLDGSEYGAAALPTAKSLSQVLKAKMELLRVVVPSSPQRSDFLSFTDTTIEELIAQAEKGQQQRIAAAEDYLHHVEELLKESGHAVSTTVILGAPAERILDYAEENEIDLICMSSHGRSGITRWIFGSVTEKVLHTGKVPVLVVHSQ